MLDPVAMKTQIMDNILARIPAGEAFRVRNTAPIEEAPTAAASDETIFNTLVQQLTPIETTEDLNGTEDSVSSQIEREIINAAQNNNLTDLLRAVIHAEGNFHPGTVRQHGGIPSLHEIRAFIPQMNNIRNENITAAYRRVLNWE